MPAVGGRALERVFGPGRRGLWRRLVARRLLAAGLAAAAVSGGLASARTPEGGPRVPVLVAVRSLPAGHEVRAADVAVQHRPARYAPTGAALQTTAEAVGRRLAGPLAAGEAVTSGRLLGPGLLVGRPAGEVAAHVAADPAAVSMVRPGDRVDVLSAAGVTVVRGAVVLAVPPADAPSTGGLGVAAGPAAAGGLVLAVSAAVAAEMARQPRDELGGAGLTVTLRP